jgi:hypothetical protein
MHPGLIVGFATVLLTGSPASATDPINIKDACTKSTKWTEQGCQCLAERAASLSADQQDYLKAFLTEDAPGQATAQAGLSVTQFADVGAFIVNAITDCQGD